MNKRLILSLCIGFSGIVATAQTNHQDSVIFALQERVTAQEEAAQAGKKLKISGYVQGVLGIGQKQASLFVGGNNGDTNQDFHRIGIRRGRIKFAYEEKWGKTVLQLDLTEKGVGLKDAYLDLNSPFGDAGVFRAGVFDRPFGHEIGYSSSRRESPERSLIVRTLFPNERDLGAMLVLRAAKTSPWHFLKLEAGLFAGNGIKPETDNRRDFIGRLSASRTIGSHAEWGIGLSYYGGGVYQGTSKVFRMKKDGFELDDTPANVGAYARRHYYGADAQLSFYGDAMGMTSIRGEYIGGTQPGTESSSKSPNSSSIPTVDTYVRPFSGGYILLAQDLATLPLTALVKYDWYDPNTRISGDAIGSASHTGKADISYRTLGMGLLYKVSSAIRLTAYYELVNNEKTSSLASYATDQKDNRFSFVVQCRF